MNERECLFDREGGFLYCWWNSFMIIWNKNPKKYFEKLFFQNSKKKSKTSFGIDSCLKKKKNWSKIFRTWEKMLGICEILKKINFGQTWEKFTRSLFTKSFKNPQKSENFSFETAQKNCQFLNSHKSYTLL